MKTLIAILLLSVTAFAATSVDLVKSSTSNISVTKVERVSQVLVNSPSVGSPTIQFATVCTAQDDQGVSIGSTTETISRSFADVAKDAVVLPDGTKLTGAQFQAAFQAFYDLWHAQDAK